MTSLREQKKLTLKLPTRVPQAKLLAIVLTKNNTFVYSLITETFQWTTSAEHAIKPFSVGRKNWVFIDTIKGVKASAVIYSLVETAKANNLRTYEYLELLLTEIPNHLDDKNFDYFENLMPWSDYVKERCHTLKKS